MLVIHPIDKSTEILTGLYNGLDGVKTLDQGHSSHEIKHLLNHTPSSEIIMMLGHGSDKGLFSRTDDTINIFDRIIIGHAHAYYLKKHRLIGIWCHANLFAEAEHLHGLFSGMFISEMDEAVKYGIETIQNEISVETEKFVKRLRYLLGNNTPLHEIPDLLRKMDDVQSSLTAFNYSGICYL